MQDVMFVFPIFVVLKSPSAKLSVRFAVICSTLTEDIGSFGRQGNVRKRK